MSTIAGVRGLPSLTLDLTRAQLMAGKGQGRLFAVSVVALSICNAVALMVAGGTWMFYNRWTNPLPLHVEAMQQDEIFVTSILSVYFMFAVIACALLISPIYDLAAGAATLGARGRERRLASLRLVGLSSRDVSAMAVMEAAMQAVLASLVGFIIYMATLPIWKIFTFHGIPVDPHEMLLPWTDVAMVLAATSAIAMMASWFGLARVRITPLGVARRDVPAALHYWRVIVFVLLLVAMVVVQTVVRGSEVTALQMTLTLCITFLALMVGVNLVMPWLLQLTARLFARSGNPSMMWAARRIQAAPRQTWKHVAPITLMALLAAFMGTMPIAGPQEGIDPGTALYQTVSNSTQEVTAGVYLTMVFTVLLTATSVYIHTSSDIYERAEQTTALAKLGASPRFISSVVWWQSLAPMALSIIMGTVVGVLFAMPFAQLAAEVTADSEGASLWVALLINAVGIVIFTLAIWATRGQQRDVLSRHMRRND